MKKRNLLGLLLLLVFPMLLISCSSSEANMSKSQLEASFNRISNTVMGNLQIFNSANGSSSKVISQAKKGLKTLNSEETKLSKNKNEKDLNKDLKSYIAIARNYLNSAKSYNVEDEQIASFFQAAKNISNGYFAGDDTKSIKDYNEWAVKHGFTNINSYLEAAKAETTSDESQTTTQEADVPTDYKTALVKAASYSKTMHMSKQDIHDQLISEFEQFSPEAAQYAVDNLAVDYNANALAKAKSYQSTMSMSLKLFGIN